MEQLTKGQKLQLAYRHQVLPYGDFVQFAVTLTLKQSAKIRVKRFDNYGDEHFEFFTALDEDKLRSTVHYFTKLLTHELYGNHSKHKNKRAWAQPLLVAFVEGRNTSKRTHLHLALGNVPKNKMAYVDTLVRSTWSRCDFANQQVCVKPVTDSFGWLSYVTKEVGYTDNDAFEVCSSVIPPFIHQSICT